MHVMICIHVESSCKHQENININYLCTNRTSAHGDVTSPVLDLRVEGRTGKNRCFVSREERYLFYYRAVDKSWSQHIRTVGAIGFKSKGRKFLPPEECLFN